MSLPPLLIDVPRNPILAVGLPLSLGIATGFITRTSKHSPDSLWYKSLQRPSWEPPRWAFPIVWPILYIGMGYASHLNVKSLDRTPPGLGRTKALRALKLYYAQLFLNQLWTPLFFGAGQQSAAFANLVALTGTVAAWGITLADVEPKAAYIAVPYFAWTAYASVLNGYIWWQNTGQYYYQKLIKKSKSS